MIANVQKKFNSSDTQADIIVHCTALVISQSTTDMIANVAKKFTSSDTQADIIVQLPSYHKVLQI